MNMENKGTFKILSIDGGGIRGIIPAKVLSDMEDGLRAANNDVHLHLCDYFDMICGTSTGSIIALGLALGISAHDILDLYIDNADKIFPDSSLSKSLIRDLPLYASDYLKKKMTDTFAKCTPDRNTRLGDCKTRVLIPTYVSSRGEVHIFKTPHLPEYNEDWQIPAADVALSSSAAPAYFNPYSFKFDTLDGTSSVEYINNIDGGIFANNPSMIGLTEAVCNLHVPIADVKILSIGTGNNLFCETNPNKDFGPRYWISPLNRHRKLRIYEMVASSQSEYVDSMMRTMYTGAGCVETNYFRLQHDFKKRDIIGMDNTDPESIQLMIDAGTKLFEPRAALLSNTFLSAKRQEYTPCYAVERG
jgi:hypothetical protein